MKKILKTSFLIGVIASLGMINTNAKVMTADDIEKALNVTEDGEVFGSESAYLFGKHIYVNTFTMADSIAAANTLDGATDAILVYKNGENHWSNAVTGDDFDNSDFSMEVVKIVGTKFDNGNVFHDSTLTQDDNYVDQNSRPDGRYEAVFLDETSPVQITSIRSLSKIAPLGGNQEADDIHAYNTEALKVDFSANTLKLTEKTPLVSYYNKLAGKTGNVVGLLVKTNKALPDQYEITFGNNTALKYNSTTKADYNGATAHGGASNEFIVWIDQNTFKTTKKIILKDNTTTLQEINVTYDRPETVYETAAIEGSDISLEDKIAITSEEEGVTFDYVVKTFGETAKAIFFANEEGIKAEDTSREIRFTFNGNNKLIKNTGVVDLITVKDNSVTKYTGDIDKYDYITISAPVADPKAENTYIVTINTIKHIDTEHLADSNIIKVVVDFSNLLDSLSSIDNTTKHVYQLTKTDLTTGHEFATKNYTSDKVTVKFVIKENLEELALKDAYLPDPSQDIFDNTIDAGADRNQIIQTTRGNIKALNSEVTNSYDADAKDYNVELRAKDLLTSVTGVTNGNDYNNKKPYALVVDFGVDRKNLTVAGAGVVAIGVNCSGGDKTECTKSLSAYGAKTSTAFVVILADAKEYAAYVGGQPTEENTFTVTNTVTGVVTTVNAHIVEVASHTAKDTNLSSNNVVPADSNVIYKSNDDAASRAFLVPEDITSFRAAVDGKEYTFNCADNQFTYGSSINIVKAYVAKNEDTTNNEAYNQASTKVVSNTKDSINLSISRDLDQTSEHNKIQLILDFGEDVSGIVFGAEVEDVTKDMLPAGLDETKLNNYGLIEVEYDNELTEDTFVITADNVENNVTINVTRLANSTDIKAVSAKKVNGLESGNTSLGAENKIAANTVVKPITYNLEGINRVDVVNGVVKIYVDKDFTGMQASKLTANATNLKDSTLSHGVLGSGKAYIAVLVDLNNKTDENPTNAVDFGATGRYTLVWLDLSQFTDANCETKEDNKYCAKVSFTTNDPENEYNNEEVVFEVIDESKALTLNTLKATDSNAVPASVKDAMNTAGYTQNQGNVKVSFNSTSRVLTLSKAKSSAEFLSYTTNGSAKKWIAVTVDFGEKIDLDTIATHSATDVHLERIDNSTSYILWLNADNTFATGSKDVVQFKSVRDNVPKYSITVVNKIVA